MRLLIAALVLVPCAANAADEWTTALRTQIERIDRESPGRLGVFVKRLDSGATVSYQADRAWYLGSALKVPIALAVLKTVESGRHRMNETVTLQSGDKVDGSGPLVWQKDGTRYNLAELLRGMLMVSDNTAANMLVRTIGVDTLNEHARSQSRLAGFERLTDFSQVRHDVYRELHPDADKLSNRQLVEIAGAPMGPKRVAALRRALSLQSEQLAATGVDQAYERYYARGINSATLSSYGETLERLVRGRLLSPDPTALMFKLMKYDSYDAYRLEAGLPRTVRFIHKTGTQHRRACHAGVIEPQDGGARAIVVVACAEDLDEHKEAGAAFERIGRAITRTVLKG